LGGIELTVRGVAERLRVSTATVYALCRSGELQHHRISHAIRISEGGLAEYLDGAGRRAPRLPPTPE
jgi:excisionase family DNA binding protein